MKLGIQHRTSGVDISRPPREPPRRIAREFVFVLGGVALLAAGIAVYGIAKVVVGPLLVLALLAPFTRRWLLRFGGEALSQAYAIAAIYSVLVSTLVFRSRSSAALANNPLDGPGLFRVGALGLAAALAAISLFLTMRRRKPKVPVFARLYGGYIFAATLPIVIAVSPGLVTFRVGDLITCFLVFLASYRAFQGQMEVPLRHLMFFIYGLLAATTVSALLDPTAAFEVEYGMQRIHGLYPSLSSDDLGILGSICVAYGLGRRRPHWIPVIAGAAMTVTALHRTGVVAVAFIVLLHFFLSKRSVLTIVGMAAAVVLMVVVGSGVLTETWNRGQRETEIETLSSRTIWWSAGLDAVERSPVTGLGLSSGTRYEVFSGLGLDETPTLHGTLPEVIVGTGLIGVGFFLSSVVMAFVGAWNGAWKLSNRTPLLLLAALLVNGTTHATIELGGICLLVFLLAGSAALRPPTDDSDRRRRLSFGLRPRPVTRSSAGFVPVE